MQSFPFTSQVTYDESGNPIYDRAVDSTVLRNVLKLYYNNGIFPNPSTNFQVVSDSGMQVKVKAGTCLINGATGYEVSERTLQVQASESSDRIDTVVLRLNDNTDYRNIDLYIVKGTAASSPSAPALTRTSSIWEIGLANLYISANCTTVPTERITDTRLNSDRCGIVAAIQTIDTTGIFNQYQAALDEYLGVVAEAIDGTLAGSLVSTVNEINKNLTANSIPLIYDYQNGKYGFNTSPTRGADTFHPFSNEDEFTERLYSALQYSGLVTATMEFDEMCTALLTAFPEQDQLLVPALTSNTSYGVISSTTLEQNSSPIWHLMDRISNNWSYRIAFVTDSLTVVYQFPNGLKPKLTYVILYSSNFTDQRVGVMSIYGSNDGTNWATLKSNASVTVPASSTAVFQCVKVQLSVTTGKYNYYKFVITKANSYGILSELELYGKPY